MHGGVCAGLGEYLSIDPTIIRLIFILLFLGGSSGLWIYLIMLLIVPIKLE
jgi:phage shock protein C